MRRREFLRRGVQLGSSALLTAAGVSFAQQAQRKIYLGLVTYNLARNWDLETIIRRCEAHGFERVELRTTHKHGVEPSLSAEQRRRVRERFARSKVRLISLGTTCEFHSPDAKVLQKNKDTAKEFIKLAKDVGAAGIKVRPNGLPQGVPVDKTLKQIGDSLRELGEWSAAGGYNIELWLEVHGRGTSHVPYIKQIMEIANHPLVKVTWNCNRSDLINGSCRENWLLVHKWVRTLHIHDLWDESQYPWRELFSLLKETQWSGNALWERGAEAKDPDALMEKQRQAFLELLKLAL